MQQRLKMELIHNEHCLLLVIKVIWNGIQTLKLAYLLINFILNVVETKCCPLLIKHRRKRLYEVASASQTLRAASVTNLVQRAALCFIRVTNLNWAVITTLTLMWTLHRHKAAAFTCSGCLLCVTLGPSSGCGWSLRATEGCDLETSLMILNADLDVSTTL